MKTTKLQQPQQQHNPQSTMFLRWNADFSKRAVNPACNIDNATLAIRGKGWGKLGISRLNIAFRIFVVYSMGFVVFLYFSCIPHVYTYCSSCIIILYNHFGIYLIDFSHIHHTHDTVMILAKRRDTLP